MFLQIIYLLVASTAVVFLLNYFGKFVHLLLALHQSIIDLLTPLFSQSAASTAILEIIALTLSTVIVVAIPTLIYMLLRQRTLPYIIPLSWAVWVLFATAVIVK